MSRVLASGYGTIHDYYGTTEPESERCPECNVPFSRWKPLGNGVHTFFAQWPEVIKEKPIDRDSQNSWGMYIRYCPNCYTKCHQTQAMWRKER